MINYYFDHLVKLKVAEVAALGFALKGAGDAHALLADRQRDRELEEVAGTMGSAPMYPPGNDNRSGSSSSGGHNNSGTDNNSSSRRSSRSSSEGRDSSSDGGGGGVGARSQFAASSSSSSSLGSGGLSASLVAADDGTAFDVEALGTGLEETYRRAFEHLNAEYSDCLVRVCVNNMVYSCIPVSILVEGERNDA